MTTLEVSEDQPYIYRLSYLGVEAQHRGKGPEFAFEVSHLLFGGTKKLARGRSSRGSSRTSRPEPR